MAITINNATKNGIVNQGNQAQKNLETSMAKLASGKKITAAKDNAALLAIADRLTSEIRGLNQAARNANDGISVTQVADGALQEVQSNQQRLRELAVQAGNGILSDQDRQALQAEAQQLQEQIAGTVSNTEFNGLKVLASDNSFTLQVGSGTGDTVDVSTQNLSDAFTPIDLSTQAGATAALASLDKDMQTVSDFRGKLGAAQSGLEAAVSNIRNAAQSAASARSQIQDVDVAQESANSVSAMLSRQSTVSVQAQANQAAEQVLKLL